MTGRDISQKEREISDWDIKIQRELLASHHAEHAERKKVLWAECEATTGHEFHTVPSSRDLMGNYPEICRWCKKHKTGE